MIINDNRHIHKNIRNRGAQNTIVSPHILGQLNDKLLKELIG